MVINHYILLRCKRASNNIRTRYIRNEPKTPNYPTYTYATGFVKGDGIDQRFEPTLVWTSVGAKSNIAAQFTPVLRAYVTRDYQASQLLRGEVETDTIWEQNINELNDVTGWNFQEDDANGGFSITPAG
ncbi:hypothetical protein FRC09_005513, partial [Ceratobasidium sp. 395]